MVTVASAIVMREEQETVRSKLRAFLAFLGRSSSPPPMLPCRPLFGPVFSVFAHASAMSIYIEPDPDAPPAPTFTQQANKVVRAQSRPDAVTHPELPLFALPSLPDQFYSLPFPSTCRVHGCRTVEDASTACLGDKTPSLS